MTMYLLKLNIALIVLFGFYKLMFSGDTFFSWRRATLIGMYLVAMLVPGLNCSYWINKSVGMVSVANEYAAIVLPAVTITQGSGGAMNWETTAMVIYNMVVCLLLLRFFVAVGFHRKTESPMQNSRYKWHKGVSVGKQRGTFLVLQLDFHQPNEAQQAGNRRDNDTRIGTLQAATFRRHSLYRIVCHCLLGKSIRVVAET